MPSSIPKMALALMVMVLCLTLAVAVPAPAAVDLIDNVHYKSNVHYQSKVLRSGSGAGVITGASTGPTVAAAPGTAGLAPSATVSSPGAHKTRRAVYAGPTAGAAGPELASRQQCTNDRILQNFRDHNNDNRQDSFVAPYCNAILNQPGGVSFIPFLFPPFIATEPVPAVSSACSCFLGRRKRAAPTAAAETFNTVAAVASIMELNSTATVACDTVSGCITEGASKPTPVAIGALAA